MSRPGLGHLLPWLSLGNPTGQLEPPSPLHASRGWREPGQKLLALSAVPSSPEPKAARAWAVSRGYSQLCVYVGGEFSISLLPAPTRGEPHRSLLLHSWSNSTGWSKDGDWGVGTGSAGDRTGSLPHMGAREERGQTLGSCSHPPPICPPKGPTQPSPVLPR